MKRTEYKNDHLPAKKKYASILDFLANDNTIYLIVNDENLWVTSPMSLCFIYYTRQLLHAACSHSDTSLKSVSLCSPHVWHRLSSLVEHVSILTSCTALMFVKYNRASWKDYKHPKSLGNTNEIYNEISLHTHYNGYSQKDRQH